MNHHDLLHVSDALTNQLQLIAKARGANNCCGSKNILFEKIIVDVFDFGSSKSDNQLILEQISVWKDTEKADWILDNIANIIVSGLYRADREQIYLHIHASVTDSVATEYWLKWSE